MFLGAIINGEFWQIIFVEKYDKNLMRSDGSFTLGMTDGNTRKIYIFCDLKGDKLEKVLAHEICHAFCFSYNVFLPIEQEEFLCEFVSKYGREIFGVLDIFLQNFR